MALAYHQAKAQEQAQAREADVTKREEPGCPKCGSMDRESTCIGVIGGDRLDQYRANRHTCLKCRHRWHGRDDQRYTAKSAPHGAEGEG